MGGEITRRRASSMTGLVIVAALGGCAYSATRPLDAPAASNASPSPTTARVGRLRLHMFQTGWVAVKAEHKAYSGPSALRFPAIMVSQSWTDWMPITAFAIEHPEGLFVVDTGETAQILEPGYTDCDPATGMFYRRNLQFALRRDDELGPQMRRAGLDPDRVAKVIMTHLHSDHMGGMRHFPRSEFLVSQAARGGHNGALMCRIPRGLNIRAVTMGDTPAGVFNQSVGVTADGAIRIAPTPGHADGHQSVLIEDEGVSVCVVGDAAFTLNQIIRGDIGGIVENVADTRRSALTLKQQLEAFNTVMLPTHDPENATRLGSL
ncbi:MAG: N-acyl homoserine lactonase family protein [Pseudomonadota bacterium]